MLRFIGTAIVASLLAACAGSGGMMEPREELQCPSTQMMVCTGGTISKVGNSSRREPRFCDCVDRNQMNR